MADVPIAILSIRLGSTLKTRPQSPFSDDLTQISCPLSCLPHSSLVKSSTVVVIMIVTNILTFRSFACILEDCFGEHTNINIVVSSVRLSVLIGNETNSSSASLVPRFLYW